MIVYQCSDCYTTLRRADVPMKSADSAMASCTHPFAGYHEIDLYAAQTATLFTIGTSGKDMRQFLQALDARQVEMIIDTRWLPLSRHKPEFSKTRLAKALTLRERSIDYWHCRVLGSPPELRKRLHETQDYFTFFAEYHQHMIAQQEALRCVEALVADRQRVALLCSEASQAECHRSVLATEIFRRLGGSPGLVHL